MLLGKRNLNDTFPNSLSIQCHIWGVPFNGEAGEKNHYKAF